MPASRTVLMAVHIYGRRLDMDRLARLADRFNCFLMEDSAEAHGVKPHSRTDAHCVSFYKNKIVAGEEGGAVWFRDPAHAAYARQLRNLGFTDAHDFNHVPRGCNYRLSNANALQIIHGRNGLDNYALNLKERRDIEGWYDDAMVNECVGDLMSRRDAPWVHDLRLPDWTKQCNVVEALLAAGIQARHCFKPMKGQREFKDCRLLTKMPSGMSMSNAASREIIYLPIQPSVTTLGDCRRAFEVIGRALG